MPDQNLIVFWESDDSPGWRYGYVRRIDNTRVWTTEGDMIFHTWVHAILTEQDALKRVNQIKSLIQYIHDSNRVIMTLSDNIYEDLHDLAKRA